MAILAKNFPATFGNNGQPQKPLMQYRRAVFAALSQYIRKLKFNSWIDRYTTLSSQCVVHAGDMVANRLGFRMGFDRKRFSTCGGAFAEPSDSIFFKI
jgi:hypothetical protein